MISKAYCLLTKAVIIFTYHKGYLFANRICEISSADKIEGWSDGYLIRGSKERLLLGCQTAVAPKIPVIPAVRAGTVWVLPSRHDRGRACNTLRQNQNQSASKFRKVNLVELTKDFG